MEPKEVIGGSGRFKGTMKPQKSNKCVTESGMLHTYRGAGSLSTSDVTGEALQHQIQDILQVG
jgi:hypothetical protein